MTSYDFIFSDKPSTRILRHVSFWFVFSTHFFIQSLLVPGVNEALTPRTPLGSFTNIAYFLPIYFISVYIFIELVIPKLLFRGHYTLFFFSTAGLLLFNFAGCYFAGLLYEHVELKIPYSHITFADNKYHAIVNGGFVSVILLAMAGGIKIAKKWFQKQRENEALAQAKINSELQLLKIQINPRFLFHSLHSVKQHILTNSSQAPKLILQVADLLSYILYESDQTYVPLEKELGIVKDYIALEENTTGENLQTNIMITGEVAGKYVTPLILLSIVEAGYEYFLTIPSQQSFSELMIDIKGDELDFSLTYKNLSGHFVESVFELNKKFEGINKQLSNLHQGHQMVVIESIPEKVTIVLKNLSLHISQLLPGKLEITRSTYENV